MRTIAIYSTAVLLGPVLFGGSAPAQAPSAATIDLADRLTTGKLRAVNRQATALSGGRRGVHVDAKPGNGVVWVEGTEFSQGTVELDVRGKDAFQQSFLGLAFHGKDDNSYEAVYLRPFNFRAEDPARHQHAVQYISLPDYDWPRLRKEFPEEFENPVDASVSPTEWVLLRVVVKGQTIQIFAGPVKTPTLEVRKLGTLEGGRVGLWVGNNSDGDFANLRITPAK